MPQRQQQIEAVAQLPKSQLQFVARTMRWPCPGPHAEQRQQQRRARHPEGVDALHAPDHVLFDKIKQIPPQRLAEVEDFVDVLREREAEQRLTHAAAKASEASFGQVWDNDEDAAYDRM